MISIVISTKGKDSQALKPLLSSLKNNLQNKEIIVVDQNAEDMGIQRLVVHFQENDNNNEYIYLKDKQVGLSAGRNFGLKYASKNWVWFLDDDAVLPTGFSKDIEDILLANEREMIILYGTVYELESKKPFLKRSIFTKRLHLWNFDSVCSAALIFNKRVFEKIGIFDKNFGIGARFGAAEETDLILRSLKAGVKILFQKDLTILHPKDTGVGQKKFSYGHGVGALYRKHLCSSAYLTAVLGFKFILEVTIRSGMALIGTSKSNLHFYYLKGFLTGFASYTK
jgi:GT2 family glycosyltransferase